MEVNQNVKSVVQRSDMSSNIEDIIDEVTRRLSLGRLKPKQMEAIIAFVGGRDVFVSLPTGYGKSIIYASLPFIFDSIKGKFVLYSAPPFLF